MSLPHWNGPMPPLLLSHLASSVPDLRLCRKIEYIVATVGRAINSQYIVNSCRDLSSLHYSWVPGIAKCWKYIDYWSRRGRPKYFETSINVQKLLKNSLKSMCNAPGTSCKRLAFRFWRTKRPKQKFWPLRSIFSTVAGAGPRGNMSIYCQ